MSESLARAALTPSRHTAVDHFVYSPASSYPTPVARLVDRDGAELHTWSNATAQPAQEGDPPSFLRGWNHVEVAADGCLFATVPLQALLKLDRDSSVLWRADVTAHHDLAVAPDGAVHVLTEEPRRITVDGSPFTVLDNLVTVLGDDGRRLRDVSLYDALTTDPALRALVHDQVRGKDAAFRKAGVPLDEETSGLLLSASHDGPPARALTLLRLLPGSPCDVLHTNTVEILHAHPSGLWPDGALLVSMRNLDLIAAVAPDGSRVLWSWGPGTLSGQHQPTMAPGGNVVVLDNGVNAARSRVLEIDPVRGVVVWEYRAEPPGSFFTPVAGGAEPLPGGSVLVTDATAGRVFEVARDGRVTWQWRTRKEPGATGTGRATLYRMAGIPDATVRRIGGRGPGIPGPAPDADA
ncbi:arylsulfotransferase family protein [Streptomyces sp. NBC_01477]|uniref:arylsulfotransferase family protein n=1 Tax=Streptomyces sp. NBC_01477 TaxID=2976015 RepID=UPI002E347300|nr:arylsulfotransferase family protein [Streptomyces sp. NBC_01477]